MIRWVAASADDGDIERGQLRRSRSRPAPISAADAAQRRAAAEHAPSAITDPSPSPSAAPPRRPVPARRTPTGIGRTDVVAADRRRAASSSSPARPRPAEPRASRPADVRLPARVRALPPERGSGRARRSRLRRRVRGPRPRDRPTRARCRWPSTSPAPRRRSRCRSCSCSCATCAPAPAPRPGASPVPRAAAARPPRASASSAGSGSSPRAIAGGDSDAAVATLFLWVYGWVGRRHRCPRCVGPVWQWLDPFATLHDLGAGLLRRLGVRGWATRRAARRALGRWPAVVGFVFFVWLELVRVGRAAGPCPSSLVGYTALTLAMMAQFGRDAWRPRARRSRSGSGLLGPPRARSPLDPTSDGRRPAAGRSRAGLLEPGWTCRRRRAGRARRRLDPLRRPVADRRPGSTSSAHPASCPRRPPARLPGDHRRRGARGRPARRLGRDRRRAAADRGRLPRRALPDVPARSTASGSSSPISDPLQHGWDLFGTAFFVPTPWLPPGLVWTIQLAAVVGGHMLGAWAGPRRGDRGRSRRPTRRMSAATDARGAPARSRWPSSWSR